MPVRRGQVCVQGWESSRSGTVGWPPLPPPSSSTSSSSSRWHPPLTEHRLEPRSLLGLLHLGSFQSPEADFICLDVEMRIPGPRGAAEAV